MELQRPTHCTSRRVVSAPGAALAGLALALASPATAQSESRDVAEAERQALYDSIANEPRMTPLVRLVQAVTPAVVFVRTEDWTRSRTIFGPRDQVRRGAGSGVVIHSSGYVVTNYHVVEGAERITVSFDGDPGRYRARLAGYVRAEDLALLQILDVPDEFALASTGDAPSATFPTVRMGTSVDLMAGEPVVAIGNPHGQAHTVSTGIISGLARDVPVPSRGLHFHGLVQTDASINRGNSGGPLLNARGELIGINTAMDQGAENIGFAIPVDRVKQVLTDALFPQARGAWLGFEVDLEGDLRVTRVTPDGPAERAGICEGDRLVSLGGHPLENAEEFLHESLLVAPREGVEVGVERNGRVDTVSLISWEKFDGILFDRLGVLVREEPIDGQRYLVVGAVQSGGPADQIGMQPDDVLPAMRPEVEGQVPRAFRIQDREVLARLVEMLPAGTLVQFDVYRDSNQDGRAERLAGRLKLR